MTTETAETFQTRRAKLLEKYKPFPDIYARGVSASGDMINMETTKAYKHYVASGYATVKARSISENRRKTFLVHRLVYEAFMGPIPKGMWVNHKDGNKLNNHISNLELTTPKQNHEHARDVLRRSWVKGDKNPNQLLS